jgi:hypothetical protein
VRLPRVSPKEGRRSRIKKPCTEKGDRGREKEVHVGAVLIARFNDRNKAPVFLDLAQPIPDAESEFREKKTKKKLGGKNAPDSIVDEYVSPERKSMTADKVHATQKLAREATYDAVK